jgi:capsular exopolysaccharide synthesis family protein
MKEFLKIADPTDEGDRGVVVGRERFLPSTEVRDPVPEWADDEFNLRDYLDVLIRRKWLILSFLALVFVSTLVFTLSQPKIYKAEGAIEVMVETPKVTKFEEVVSPQVDRWGFFATQVQLLGSPTLAERVIQRLNLSDPQMQEALFGKHEPGFLDGIKKFFLGLIKGILNGQPTDARQNTDAAPTYVIPKDVLKQRALLDYIKGNFSAKPDKEALIVRVTFTARDRQLAQTILNAYIENFIQMEMEKKLDASKVARSFLMKQIDRVKITLEKAEEQLNRFGQQAGIVSLDTRLNSIYSQLEEVNTAMAQAETRLIEAEAVYRQATTTDNPESLSLDVNNELISGLKQEYAKVRSEYEKLSVTFHDAYPAVQALKSRIQSVEKQIQIEQKQIFKGIRNQYETALKQYESLKKRAEEQKQAAMELNERATQYKIIEREVETNKEIYQSLLERVKEIESMVGVSASNIHVIDQARLPIMPFKPDVRHNLLFAMMVGLMGGIGLAFVMEYLTDTIVNPEELNERFRIPILGVLPLTKPDKEIPLEKIFINNPRSALSEALRTTRVSIQLSGADMNAKSFLISSTQPNEGKSTVAINLAYTFAGAGERVMLIDADLRKPRLHKLFQDQAHDNPGLSKYLAGVVDRPQFCQASDEKNLYFIPAGPIPPNPVELLASHRFKRLMEFLHKKFDRIIVDGPPHHGFADVLVLCRNVGGLILVSAVGESTRSNIRQFKKAVLNIHGTILGCIINKVNLTKRYGYRSYYRYYQAYSSYSYDDGEQKKTKRKKVWVRKKKQKRSETYGETGRDRSQESAVGSKE